MLLNSKCLVCDSNKLEKITSLISEFIDNIYHDVAICKNCGHIQVDPVFTESEYSKINDLFFSTKYLVNGKQNPDNSLKLSKLNERLNKYIKKGMNVLDVGAGEGWAFEYFKNSGLNYSAIEPIPKLAGDLINRGAVLIGKSLFDDYSDFYGRFDLVIFRHALEHMLDPLAALKTLKKFLSAEGLLYVVVPNAMNFSILKGFRTSFLRPVHISYFHPDRLLQLASRAQIINVDTGIENEIWVLLKSGSVQDGLIFKSSYLEQKKKYKTLQRKSIFKDFSGTYKIFRNRFKNKIKTLL